jgi:hypothetical protein
MNELDRSRIEALVVAFLLEIKKNYMRGPTSRDRALEALNALASCAALVIHGADGMNGEAHRFFVDALEMQLKDNSQRFSP